MSVDAIFTPKPLIDISLWNNSPRYKIIMVGNPYVGKT